MFVLPTLVIEERDLAPFIEAFKQQGNYKGDVQITNIEAKFVTHPMAQQGTGNWQVSVQLQVMSLEKR